MKRALKILALLLSALSLALLTTSTEELRHQILHFVQLRTEVQEAPDERPV